MAENNASSLKLKIIVATLETDMQALADEIGEQRPVLSGVISGQRKATRARKKLADALCKKVTNLIVPADTPAEEKAA